MKTVQDPTDHKVPAITTSPELVQYRGKVLFPEKLAMAKERLKNVRLPDDCKPRE